MPREELFTLAGQPGQVFKSQCRSKLKGRAKAAWVTHEEGRPHGRNSICKGPEVGVLVEHLGSCKFSLWLRAELGRTPVRVGGAHQTEPPRLWSGAAALSLKVMCR